MSNRAISTELIELGERIRKRRQEMKLSQESFAEKAGISVNTVSRIEGGQTAMSVEIFRKMIENWKRMPISCWGKREAVQRSWNQFRKCFTVFRRWNGKSRKLSCRP